MKNEKDNVTPLFINGEFNDRTKRQRPTLNNNDKLPTKRYGFGDVLLTLIGIALIGYGIYMYMNKDESKKENDNSNSVVTEEKKSNKNSTKEKKELDYAKLVSLTEVNEKRLFSATDLKLLQTGLEVSQMSDNLKLGMAARISEKKYYDNGSNSYILDDELDSKMKLIFGNINYNKGVITYGNNTFTYNQETKMYYLFENSEKFNLNYKRYNYVTKDKLDDKLIVKNYVAYTMNDKTKSTTLNNTALNIIIDDNNIKDQIGILKYYEYEFVLEDGSYHLKKITLK